MNQIVDTTTAAQALPNGRNFDVAGRVVIITGGGQGIGREYARQFAAAGAVSIIADINARNAESVAAEIVQSGGRAYAFHVDVSDASSVQALVDEVVKTCGRVDVLINNAGIFATIKMRPFEEIPLEEWDQVLRVNITGCYLMARAVAPVMKAQRWGRIINITSSSVPLGLRNYLHYVTSKSALIGMTNAMARELGGFGINVNCIQPGATFTEIPRETVTDEARKRITSQQCIPREEVPMDLVGIVIFLCTEAASFITGQTLACDGGMTHW